MLSLHEYDVLTVCHVVVLLLYERVWLVNYCPQINQLNMSLKPLATQVEHCSEIWCPTWSPSQVPSPNAGMEGGESTAIHLLMKKIRMRISKPKYDIKEKPTNSVDFWKRRISRSATVPGRYLWAFFIPPKDGACFGLFPKWRGAFPP